MSDSDNCSPLQKTDKKKSDSDSDSNKEKYVARRRMARRKAIQKRSIDLKLFDKLLFSTDFDEKYWQGEGYQTYEKIGSELNKADLETVKRYLEAKEQENKDNSWILFWKARVTFITNKNRITANVAKWLELSLNLGNPYAMIEYAGSCLSVDQKDEKDQLYLKAFEKGYYAGLINHIDHYFNNVVQELEGDGIDKGIEMQVLSDLEKLTKFRENSEIIDTMIQTYSNLNQMFENKYTDEYVQWTRKQENGTEILFEEHSDYIEAVIDKYIILKEKHKKLEEAYNELKKVKEMDFNNIVSSQVGEFL